MSMAAEKHTDEIVIDGERWLPREAFAKLVHIHWRTAWRWQKTGRGPRCFYIGRRPFYPLADVKQWLANGGKRPVGRPRKVSV